MANAGIKFLIWTYFNLDVDESCEDIIGKCIDKAYVDATKQGAFNTIATRTERLSIAKFHLFQAISQKTNISCYDTWHKTICLQLTSDYSQIKSKITSKSAFTYGNAQKWVNMTVKYLYIFRSLMHDLGDVYSKCFCAFYDIKFSPFESDFHTPIDNFIMEAIWPSRGLQCWIPDAQYLKSQNLGKYSPSKHKAWSNFDDTDYTQVLQHIRTIIPPGMKPLEWENERWINIAKSKKR